MNHNNHDNTDGTFIVLDTHATLSKGGISQWVSGLEGERTEHQIHAMRLPLEAFMGFFQSEIASGRLLPIAVNPLVDPAPSEATGQIAMFGVDCETTGFDDDLPSKAILEVSLVPLDGTLQKLAPGLTLLIRAPEHALAAMHPTVVEMHTRNGLLAAIKTPAALTLEAAEQALLSYVDAWAGDQRLPLFGSSVHFDRNYLKHFMPSLAKRFSHRNVDVSSFKELIRANWPKHAPMADKSAIAHRTLADIDASIREALPYLRLIALGVSQTPR